MISRKTVSVIAFLILASLILSEKPIGKIKPTPVPTTATILAKRTATPVSSATSTDTLTNTATVTEAVTETVETPTNTPDITAMPTQSNKILPYPDAPMCADHSNNEFHTLWNEVLGCHYDHEHGENPFTSEVTETFPDFDLFTLLGNTEIGHDHLTSPMENTMKHKGFKWQVQTITPRGCFLGFEDATVGVDAAVIEYHAFGVYSIEFEARNHSTASLVRQCMPGSSDYGYVFTIQHQDYGQRVTPYQGNVLGYPNTPLPAYDSSFGPYFTLDCFGGGIATCRPGMDYVRLLNTNANSIWTSKGRGVSGAQTIFNLLFRVRDNYELLDSSDLVYPFTFQFVCGGDSYDPVGCRYNNSTSRVHEIQGNVLSTWDNSSYDSDSRPGRVTADLIVNGFPVKLVNAYVGRYGTQLISDKANQFSPEAQPERDIYFCNGVVCSETSPGAVPSGWIGSEN